MEACRSCSASAALFLGTGNKSPDWAGGRLSVRWNGSEATLGGRTASSAYSAPLIDFHHATSLDLVHVGRYPDRGAHVVDRLRGPDRSAAAQDRADRRGDGGDLRHHGSDSTSLA
jgi:hypothetical protein